MRNITILYLLILSSVFAFAAKPNMPEWMDAINREVAYPEEQFYTGFVSVSPENGENKEATYDRAQINARVAAVSSIQVTVEQTVQRYMQNVQAHGDASTIDIMKSYANSRIGIKDIPGLKVETWENPKTGDISAFAWVKKTDLSNRLMRRIAVKVGKIESEFSNIKLLIEKGDKVEAKNSLPAILPLFEDVENDQRLMLSIDPSVQDEDLSIEDVNHLKEQYRALSADLKNGINIYLKCEANLFGTNYPTLKSEIQGKLSSMGCSFVDSSENADWAVYVSAPAREYNASNFGDVTTYFTYVDANIIVEKVATGQRIFEDQISEKGRHTHNYEQAARDAYKHISPRISAIIKEQIQQ